MSQKSSVPQAAGFVSQLLKRNTHKKGWPMIPRPEQARRWASQEAAIKAEINEAKNTLDLIRMAHAIARLDALHAEMEAASKADGGH